MINPKPWITITSHQIHWILLSYNVKLPTTFSKSLRSPHWQPFSTSNNRKRKTNQKTHSQKSSQPKIRKFFLKPQNCNKTDSWPITLLQHKPNRTQQSQTHLESSNLWSNPSHNSSSQKQNFAPSIFKLK